VSRFVSWSVLLAVLLAGACGGGSDKTEGAAATTSSTAAVSAQIGGISAVVRGEAQASDGMQVEVDDNYFKPNILRGAAGQSVTLDLKSEGKSIHNFSLAEQSITQDIPAGTSASVKVRFPASGELTFFCKYHKTESGMVGALRVSA
jgi:plastocyanin